MSRASSTLPKAHGRSGPSLRAYALAQAPGQVIESTQGLLDLRVGQGPALASADGQLGFELVAGIERIHGDFLNSGMRQSGGSWESSGSVLVRSACAARVTLV
jgi:hypothetical protein